MSYRGAKRGGVPTRRGTLRLRRRCRERSARTLVFVRDAGLGRAHSAPHDVHLPSGDIVHPDLLFVAKASSHIVDGRVYGVPEYWIVDPEGRTIEVFRLDAGAYRPAGWFRTGEKVRSGTWPDLDLSVDEVLT